MYPTGLDSGYEIGYDQITANVTVSSATESTGTTIITASAYMFDGHPVIAEFFSPNVSPATVANAFVAICLFEGSTEIGRIAVVGNPAANTGAFAVLARYRFTPTAGLHTYKITAFRGSNDGTVLAGAGGTATYLPAYVRFVKV